MDRQGGVGTNIEEYSQVRESDEALYCRGGGDESLRPEGWRED